MVPIYALLHRFSCHPDVKVYVVIITKNNNNWSFFKKFKVTEWPKEDYGKFFDGDSYIILNVSNSYNYFFRRLIIFLNDLY